MSNKAQAKQVGRRFLQVMDRVLKEEIAGITTRTAFAERVGEFKQNITRIESGSRCPTVDMLVETCLAFGVNADWLLLGKGDMFKTVDSSLLERVISLENNFKQIKKKVS